MAVDSAGNLFIADSNNQRIRKVDPSGFITTVAGSGAFGYSSADEGVEAITASLAGPRGVAVDGAGNLFIADSNNHRIRKVYPSGFITTVAGNGGQGYSSAHEGVNATTASLYSPWDVAVDGAGNLFISDTTNQRIRLVADRVDTDNDGLTDQEEAAIGSDPNDPDTDGDGVLDGDEALGDTDGDGTPDYADTDSDDDGVADGDEVTLGTSPVNADSDGDGLSDGEEVDLGTDPTIADPDSDGDGRADAGDNCPSTSNADQADFDSDGSGDLCDPDDDNDYLSDADETATGTDPFNPDSDGDGYSDGIEVRVGTSPTAAADNPDTIPYDGPQSISHASVDDFGDPLGTSNWVGGISDDGRFVAFESQYPEGIVAMLRDLLTGTTKQISVESGIRAGAPSISGNGQFLAFLTNLRLVPEDTDSNRDVYIFNRVDRTFERVPRPGSTSSTSSPYISSDGRFVAFTAIGSTVHAYVFNRDTQALELVSVNSAGATANAGSTAPVVSDDGRFVAFGAIASNLDGVDNNSAWDIFLRDRVQGTTRRVSRGASGEDPNDHSGAVAISSDGQFVAFQSLAGNLISGDNNGVRDVFVYDRIADSLEIVSVDPAGTPANGESGLPTISDDGRYVAFSSVSSNLVENDALANMDIFVRDRWTGRNYRASEDDNGNESNHRNEFPRISGGGHFVAFASMATNLVVSDTNSLSDVIVKPLDVDSDADGLTDREEGYLGSDPFDPDSDSDGLGDGEEVGLGTSPINSDSDSDGVADGEEVHLGLDPLVSDSDGDGFSDGAEMAAGSHPLDINSTPESIGFTAQIGTDVVSVSNQQDFSNGPSRTPGLSADGRYVVFESYGSNLVPGDSNNASDVFVRDRLTGWVSRVSVDSSGVQSQGSSVAPAISDDGRYIAFQSSDGSLVPSDDNGGWDIFVADRVTRMVSRVSVDSLGNEGLPLGASNSMYPDISADGRFVAFESESTNLVAGDHNGVTDVFVHHRLTGETTRISVSSDGSEADNGNYRPSISGDGRYVAFSGLASNLDVSIPPNTWSDVFVRDRLNETTRQVSINSQGEPGNDQSILAGISADGRFIAFESLATNLVEGDVNGAQDIFLHDQKTGITSRISLSAGGDEANGESRYARISEGGRFVTFSSRASNLVPDDTNGRWDIFVHDRYTGQVRRVSVDQTYAQGNADSLISAINSDGRTVAFQSTASNLVVGDQSGTLDVFVHTLKETAPPLGFVAHQSSGKVAVFDTGNSQVLGELPLGSGIERIALSRDQSRLFVTNFQTGEVTVLSTLDSRTLARLPVPNPTGVAVSTDGRVAYVAGGDPVVTAFDVESQTIAGQFYAGSSPRGVALNRDGYGNLIEIHARLLLFLVNAYRAGQVDLGVGDQSVWRWPVWSDPQQGSRGIGKFYP